MSTTETKKTEKYKNPLALKGQGREETLKRKKVLTVKALQVRDDTSPGHDVDEPRAQQFAQVIRELKEKGKPVFGKDGFPDVKVFRVKDCPGHKDEEVDILWDGHHTFAGCEIAKVDEVKALVWEGTYHQAMMAAATVANVEHETNGKPLSNRDKIRAISVAAKAIIDSGIPKGEWPSNRELAYDVLGGRVSHTLVGDVDPFGRRQSGTKTGEDKKAAKRTSRVAAAASNGKPVTIEIVKRSTSQVVGSYDGFKVGEEEKAIEKFLGEHPGGLTKGELSARVKSGKDPKNGAEKESSGPRFDWAGMEGNLGYLIRGVDSAGDMFALKKSPEHAEAINALDKFAAIFKKWKAAHGPKRT